MLTEPTLEKLHALSLNAMAAPSVLRWPMCADPARQCIALTGLHLTSASTPKCVPGGCVRTRAMGEVRTRGVCAH
jgi:hypothetical protein